MDQSFVFVCRVCLTKNPSTEMWSLAVDRTRTLLFECTSVIAQPDDEYPQHLCTKCWNHCRVWNEFKILAMDTDRQMREPKGLSLKDEEGEGEDFWEEFPDGAEVFLRTKDNGNDENEEEAVEQHDVFRNIDEYEDMEENGESGSQGEVFQCDVCGKDFASQGNLSRHMQVHVGQFKCDRCPNAYEDEGQLCRHIQMKHSTRHVIKDTDELFFCSICAKSFSRRAYLQAHMIVHKDSRQFKCEDCGREFKKKHHLQHHLESHERKKLKAALKAEAKAKPKSVAKTDTG